MMADDNLSPSPSPLAESNPPRPEEEAGEKVPEGGSEPKDHPKMPNGFANHTGDTLPDTNANHLQECNGDVVRESATSAADQENNNSADSLEVAEEKTRACSTELAPATKHEAAVVESTTVESTSTVVVKEVQTAVLIETLETTASKTEEVLLAEQPKTEDAGEKPDVPQERSSHVLDELVQVTSTEEIVVITREEEEIMKNLHEKLQAKVQEKLESMAESMVLLDVKSPEDDEDGFVPIAACLPKDDNPDEEVDLPTENFEPSSEEPEIAPSANGFGESLPLSPVSSTASDKVASVPEIEQFVKSGGVKKIIPGVQKTEQPYSSCTTETKIAMEIREMREREEELRVMREHAIASPAASPVPPKTPSTPSTLPSSTPSPKEGPSPVPPGPGYRVSSVFGHKAPPMASVHEERKAIFGKAVFNKETAVEKEIRLAKDREEELRKQKGLPPREDDSFVKPSEVKSSQVRVFGKVVGANSNAAKQAATAKIQMEIEEQTQREMALRETGHIQTISQERTDAKVAKLKTADSHAHTNGNGIAPTNGIHTNGTSGHSSPDYSAPYKRSSPSPTNPRPASIFAPSPGLNKSINMNKFISNKGKDTSFTSPKNGSPFVPNEETLRKSAIPPSMVKLKRTVSVESKIQQEIMEMKQREEELRKLHLTMTNGNEENDTLENGHEDQMNKKNSIENGNGITPDEETSPRHNRLIAQWEQMIQKAES